MCVMLHTACCPGPYGMANDHGSVSRMGHLVTCSMTPLNYALWHHDVRGAGSTTVISLHTTSNWNMMLAVLVQQQ